MAELIGSERMGETEYQVVEATLSQGRARLYVGPDLLVHQISGTRQKVPFTSTVSNVRLDAAVTPDDFTFRPPPGATMAAKAGTEKLLAVGSLAPDIAVRCLDGRSVTLKQLLHDRKALMLHFWAPG